MWGTETRNKEKNDFHVFLIFLQVGLSGILDSHMNHLGTLKRRSPYQEQHLSIAVQINDKTAKTLAYSSLGEFPSELNLYEK